MSGIIRKDKNPHRKKCAFSTTGILSILLVLIIIIIIVTHSVVYREDFQNATTFALQVNNDTVVPDTVPKLTTVDCRDKVAAAHGFEIIMESMMGTLFREEGFLNDEGSVMDVGAQFGEQACHYAVLAPQRTVYALDPSPSNTAAIKKSFSVLENLKVMTMGIGETPGNAVVSQSGYNMEIGSKFEVTTMDNLFVKRNEPLAFAHIDVEGVELGVLQGGKQTIETYSPIFTIEVRVYEDEDYTRRLLNYIYDLGYDAYLINEVCGIRMDFRNILAFPRKRNKVLEYSDAFNLLMAGNLVIRVDPESIFDWVYPCCKAGGECCPSGDPNDKQCCMQDKVQSWLDQNKIFVPPQLSTFVGSRRSTQRQWYRLKKRASITNAEAKNANWITGSPFKLN